MTLEEVFTLILSLVGVILLILVTYYCAKWLNKRTTVTSSRNLRVVERINLGPDKMILLICVCGKYMLIGVSSQHVEKLCDLDEQTSAMLESQLAQEKPAAGNFSAQLAAILSSKFTGAGKRAGGESETKGTSFDLNIGEKPGAESRENEGRDDHE